MPLIAYLATDVRCSSCGETITDLLAFQWGYCCGYRPRKEASYELGDRLRWRGCSDGSVPAWAFFGDNEGNVGDPSYTDIIVREYWSEDFTHSCGTAIGGMAIEIRRGEIVRAWAYPPGEIDNSSLIYRYEPDGSPSPMPGWDDHPMSRVDLGECGGELRLVEGDPPAPKQP